MPQSPLSLRYLDFDQSEDDGSVTFDAMASVAQAQWPALQAEIVAVLQWAHQAFHRAPLDDGGDWDFDLDASMETVVPLQPAYDEASACLVVRPGAPAAPRHAASLSITGTPAFAEAFAQTFGIG